MQESGLPLFSPLRSFHCLFEMSCLASLGGIFDGDLCLCPGLDNIKRTGDDASHATSRRSGEYLQAEANITASHPVTRQPLLLLIEGKLKCREGKVSKDCSFVSRVKRAKALYPRYRLGRIPCRSIIVARVEVRIVVSALKLQASLENLRWYIYDRSCKISDKSLVKLAMGNKTWEGTGTSSEI
jgi:hypothetical protein